jgi:uncharacterized RDD family membrane protein YckC
MRRRNPEGEDQEPSLFDLPLDLPDHDRLDPEEAREEDEAIAAAPLRPRPVREERAPDRPTPLATLPPRRPAPVPTPAASAASGASATSAPIERMEAGEATSRPGLGSRFAAGLADLLVHAAIAALALAGARLLGASPTLAEWPPMVIFLLAFSFLYTILPLAFWGQTLGMTWAGLLSRNRDGEPLTFDQTARRWLGGLLTAATLGLPLLLAGKGRTLTDLLSGSNTFRAA